ncbi:MAG: polyphosphate polymerase domain-containing protein [Gammaproteobacteria bacterium]
MNDRGIVCDPIDGLPVLATTAEWQETLSRFATVDLDGLADAARSDRLDTKFVMRSNDLLAILQKLAVDYRILDVDGLRFTAYRTQYFDTEDFGLFRLHHSAGSRHYKVRTRTYLNTRQAFIEIKSKNKLGATVKDRERIERFQTELAGSAQSFVAARLPAYADRLRPALLNSFDRICLLSRHRAERLTIDLDIAVHANGELIQLPGVAVAELKQQRTGGGRRESEFLQSMRSLNIRRTAFSKYCICLLMTRRDLKHNRFKPQLRNLARLMGGPHAL